MGTIFCKCGKTLGGLKALQLKNAQVVFQQGVEVIQSLVQLRIVRHGRTRAQAMCGKINDHFRRATMKGVRDPATGNTIVWNDIWDKDGQIHLKTMRLRADALYGPAGYENISVKMESQVLSIMKRISEETLDVNLNLWRERRKVRVIPPRSAVQHCSPRTSKTCYGTCQSGCEGVLRKLRDNDDATTLRYPESLRKTSGRK